MLFRYLFVHYGFIPLAMIGNWGMQVGIIILAFVPPIWVGLLFLLLRAFYRSKDVPAERRGNEKA